MHCEKCGEKIEGSQLFCQRCGEKLSNTGSHISTTRFKVSSIMQTINQMSLKHKIIGISIIGIIITIMALLGQYNAHPQMGLIKEVLIDKYISSTNMDYLVNEDNLKSTKIIDRVAIKSINQENVIVEVVLNENNIEVSGNMVLEFGKNAKNRWKYVGNEQIFTKDYLDLSIVPLSGLKQRWITKQH